MTQEIDLVEEVFFPETGEDTILELRSIIKELRQKDPKHQLSEEKVALIRLHNENIICGKLKEEFNKEERELLIVFGNMGLIVKIRNSTDKSISRDIDLSDDSLSCGVLGLLISLEKYDCDKRGYENKAMKFSSFAFNIIRTQIRRGVSQRKNNIRLPESIVTKNRNAIKEGRLSDVIRTYEESDDEMLTEIESRNTDFRVSIDLSDLILKSLSLLRRKNSLFFKNNIQNILHYKDFLFLEKELFIKYEVFTEEEISMYYPKYPEITTPEKDTKFIASRSKFSTLLKKCLLENGY